MSLFSYNLEVKFSLHYVVCHVIGQTAFYYICLITYSVGKNHSCEAKGQDSVSQPLLGQDDDTNGLIMHKFR